jgi:hypothetical protein
MATQYGAQGSGMGNQKIPLWGLVLEIGGGKSNRHWDGTYGITARARGTRHGHAQQRARGAKETVLGFFDSAFIIIRMQRKSEREKKLQAVLLFWGGLGFAGRHGRAGWQGWQGWAGLGERVGMGWMGPRVMLISAMFSPLYFFPPVFVFLPTYFFLIEWLVLNVGVCCCCWCLRCMAWFGILLSVGRRVGARVRLCWGRRGRLGEGRRGGVLNDRSGVVKNLWRPCRYRLPCCAVLCSPPNPP